MLSMNGVAFSSFASAWVLHPKVNSNFTKAL